MRPIKRFKADCWQITVRRFRYIFPIISTLAWGDVQLSSAVSYTQEQAHEYCRSLGSSWRQMSIQELFAHKGRFPENFSYWPQTKGPSDNTEIGTGSEGDGGIIAMVGYSFYPKERNITLSPPSKKIAAACTDTPLKHPSRNYQMTSQGVEDKSASLVWHLLDATDKRAKYTYDQAKEQCDNLTLNARTWRLPTTEELYGIVDYSYYRPSVDMKYFGAMMHRYYWSSDTLSENEAFAVGFKLGSVATINKTESAYVRGVSD